MNSEAYGPLARGAFYQLRQFLEYKAAKAGVKVVWVPPAYTLQICHKCLHIHPDPNQTYRSGKRFQCGHCGWEGDADFNGATRVSGTESFVIALLGAAVNQPAPLHPPACGGTGGGSVVGLPTAGLPKAGSVPLSGRSRVVYLFSQGRYSSCYADQEQCPRKAS